MYGWESLSHVALIDFEEICLDSMDLDIEIVQVR